MRPIWGLLLGVVLLAGASSATEEKPARVVMQVPASCIADLRFGKCYQDARDGRTHCPDTTFVQKCVAVTAMKPR
jgi:hypothetical protein